MSLDTIVQTTANLNDLQKYFVYFFKVDDIIVSAIARQEKMTVIRENVNKPDSLGPYEGKSEEDNADE